MDFEDLDERIGELEDVIYSLKNRLNHLEGAMEYVDERLNTNQLRVSYLEDGDEL